MPYTPYHDGAAGGEISSPHADDKWHHVVSVQSDNTKIQIYLDGELDLENKNAAGVGSTDNAGPIWQLADTTKSVIRMGYWMNFVSGARR